MTPFSMQQQVWCVAPLWLALLWLVVMFAFIISTYLPESFGTIGKISSLAVLMVLMIVSCLQSTVVQVDSVKAVLPTTSGFRLVLPTSKYQRSLLEPTTSSTTNTTETKISSTPSASAQKMDQTQ